MDRFLIRSKRTHDGSVKQDVFSAVLTSELASDCSKAKRHKSDNNNQGDSAETKQEGRKMEVRLPVSFPRWKQGYPWLGLNENNQAICTICTEAYNLNLILRLDSHEIKSKDTWVQNGFYYWKHAAERLKKHSQCSLHFKSTEALKNVKTVNVVQHLSTANLKQMMEHRTALKKIFSTLKILGRQGLAIRGAGNDEYSNFMTILRARAEDVSELEFWLNRTGNKWLHHSIQNEILEIMAIKILSDNIQHIKKAEFYAILLDETPDISRMEQISVYFRVASRDLVTTEYFMGFYSTNSTTAGTLFGVVKDVLLRFQLPLEKLRGQCYDGASNMSGRLSGLQQQIKEEEPRALYVHCNAHNLNLAVQDGIEKVLEARKFIGVVKDMINFVRDSPKRLARFQDIQASVEEENGENAPVLAAYCPTRWVVRIKSLKTVAANYETLMVFFQELVENRDIDSSIVAKASGFYQQMESFRFLFLLLTMIEIFDRIEVLNKDLQHSELCVVDSYRKIEIVSNVMNDSRESQFTTIWDKCLEMADKYEIEEAQLPRNRKVPRRLSSSNSDTYVNPVYKSPQDYYKKIYCEIFDQTNCSLRSRFDNDSARFFKSLESFAVGKTNNVKEIIRFYREDFDESRLQKDRDFFLGIINREGTEVKDVRDIIKFMRENECYMNIVPEFMRFLRLIITIPGSTCSNERSFSVLRRVKNYLRSTVAQNRLNHVAVLHSYPDLVDKLDLDALMNEFISRNSKRASVFAMQ